MSIKKSNEITVKVICSYNEIQQILQSKGFVATRKFTLNDFYFIQKNIEIKNLTTRDILKNAVIIRDKTDDNGDRLQRIAFKKKQINENDEITSQTAFNCDVYDYKSAIQLFRELGYYELMNICEKDTIYSKDNIEFALKYIEDDYILIEMETNTQFDSIDKLKEVIDSFDIPIKKNNYFVKKAESVLNKTLNRK